jgi:hypothetical protein
MSLERGVSPYGFKNYIIEPSEQLCLIYKDTEAVGRIASMHLITGFTPKRYLNGFTVPP